MYAKIIVHYWRDIAWTVTVVAIIYVRLYFYLEHLRSHDHPINLCKTIGPTKNLEGSHSLRVVPEYGIADSTPAVLLSPSFSLHLARFLFYNAGGSIFECANDLILQLFEYTSL